MHWPILGTHHLISGGGGARKKLKKIVCRHKSQKKNFVENVGRKRKFVVEIDDKYVDQKKTPNGNIHNRESIRRNIKKKLSDVDSQKKNIVFSRRYLMVRPL